MPIHTRVCDMLGIEHPIVMGGMTGTGTPELAAAVSNAGGLGIFVAHGGGHPDKLKAAIKKMPTMTTKPWGVNMTIFPTIGKSYHEEYAQAIIDGGVKIVETAGRNPKKWVKLFKDAGLIVIHKCTSVRHALTAQRLGCDIISLDGFECAGHPGEDDVGNFVLQPRGAQELKIPYICSGGVCTGMQLAAALAMGADGVNVGTRMNATFESVYPEGFKKRMVEATEIDTALVNRNLRNTSRVYGNAVAKEVRRIEDEKGAKMKFSDIQHLVAGTRGRKAERNGDPDGGIWSAGQGIGLIKNISSVQEVVDAMIVEAEQVIQRRLTSLVKPKL